MSMGEGNVRGRLVLMQAVAIKVTLSMEQAIRHTKY